MAATAGGRVHPRTRAGGGAGVNKANGVPPAVGGLTARSLGRGTKREAGYQSLDFLVSLVFIHDNKE